MVENGIGEHETRPRSPGGWRWLLLSCRRAVVTGAAAVAVIVAHGFDQPVLPTELGHRLLLGLIAIYLLDLWASWWRRWTPGRLPIRSWDLVLPALAGVSGAAAEFGVGQGWGWLFQGLLVWLAFREVWRLYVVGVRVMDRPGMLLPLSFLSLVVVGTLLLKLPVAAAPGRQIGWIDALFTMTSAVCVTGLTVRDTATAFSPIGQGIILLFIQLGGLGIVTFGTMFALVGGQRLSLRENVSLSQMLSDQPLSRITTLVRLVVITTLGLEIVGALLLMRAWGPEVALWDRAWLSVFHSVSAFCNAGFSLFSDSFEGYRHAPSIHAVIVPLIVLGGLGLPVLDDVWRIVWQRLRRRRGKQRMASERLPRLSLHTKLVLVTTISLYIGGTSLILSGQVARYFDPTVVANKQDLGPLTATKVGAMAADASFMAVSARTAGFNTIPMDELRPAGLFVLMMLMVVGASPGGTGGGMKTTTLALLVLSVLATARQREQAEAFGRSISDSLVRRAATLALAFVGVVALATLLLLITEPFPFLKVLFEVVSAASTTGLSLGITSDLTSFGKLVIVVTMFLGRVGPLTLLAALFVRKPSGQDYAYPQEGVILG
ncbi:MAG: hypothetical protein IT442_09330 [Phycisphaeraceae bacterium]|nr:hypothetical protein [Phycisphaeraceae bacterium]